MSSQTEAIVAFLREQELFYAPNATVSAGLKQKLAVPVIGPVAVGKSTVIEEVIRLDAEVEAAGTFMSRPQREHEATVYRFVNHDESHLKKIQAKVTSRELVQYAVHPSTGYVYGSELDDYPARYNILAMLASAMSGFEALPFKDCVPIALTAEPEDWTTWLKKRVNADSADTHTRLFEARQSLEWCLTHDVAWVCNTPGNPEQAAKEIIAFIHGETNGRMSARDTGQRLFDTIEALLKK